MRAKAGMGVLPWAKVWLLAIGIALASPAVQAVNPSAAFASGVREAAPVADDPAVEARLVRIAEEVRCLVCQNESLAGSRAELANDLRREIRSMIQAGQTDQQITDFLVSRYGDFVLYRPPVNSTTWLLWFGPFLLLLTAVVFLIRFLRQRQREHAQVHAPLLTEADRERAKALLDAKDRGDV